MFLKGVKKVENLAHRFRKLIGQKFVSF